MFSAHFVRSGWIQLSVTTGTFRLAGQVGRWWSLRGTSKVAYAYHLYFDTITVGPSHEGDRDYGRSLRCLSTVLDM